MERLTLSPYSLPFILYIMRIVLICVLGVLIWQSNDARQFTADALQSASNLIEPDNNRNQTIGEIIDDFLK